MIGPSSLLKGSLCPGVRRGHSSRWRGAGWASRRLGSSPGVCWVPCLPLPPAWDRPPLLPPPWLRVASSEPRPPPSALHGAHLSADKARVLLQPIGSAQPTCLLLSASCCFWSLTNSILPQGLCMAAPSAWNVSPGLFVFLNSLWSLLKCHLSCPLPSCQRHPPCVVIQLISI